LLKTQIGFSETYKLGEKLEILHFGDASQTVLIKSEHPTYKDSISHLRVYWDKRENTFARFDYEFSTHYNHKSFTYYAKYFAANSKNQVFVASQTPKTNSAAIEYFSI
jgi:hypothetical protein